MAELLSKHVRWVRALARSLVRDDHLAEDLAQDALVAALEHPPRDPSRLTPWLSRVLENGWRQIARGEGRRRSREAERALAEGSQAAAAGAAESLAPDRALLDALEALEEPYRAAIVLRFLRELPPR